ncbi:MAG: site-specific integrase, partial [Candidatus Neomarinimicrobiota bacterium]
CRLRNISYVMVDEYLKKRQEVDKIKDATLGIEYRTLRSFFNYFVEHNFISETPMKKMKHPKVKTKKIRFLTEDEIKRLMVVVDDDNYRDLILMYLHTGARREELLKERLSWNDVDFVRKNITLHGKGGKSRTIPLNETAYEIMHRRRFVENREIPFEQNYEYMFKKIAKYYIAADIKDANIHVLRKTFGSTLCQKKLDIFTISKLMGHSSVRVTESHYAELLDKDLREGIELLD